MEMPVGRSKVSAGLLLFRRNGSVVEVLLAHPGGPFWESRDVGAWSIPKGVPDDGEDLLATAKREFSEETGLSSQEPYLELGSVRQKAGKEVFAWAFEGDADPASVTSNTMRLQWPPGSGRWITVPEIDRCEWFGLEEARQKINPAQALFLDRLVTKLEGSAKE